MPNFATICKIKGCGKPRRLDQTLALCDEHCCEYWRNHYWKGKALSRKRLHKMTELKVIELRRLRAEGYSLKELSKKYGIAWRYVSVIVHRRSWAWVA